MHVTKYKNDTHQTSGSSRFYNCNPIYFSDKALMLWLNRSWLVSWLVWLVRWLAYWSFWF